MHTTLSVIIPTYNRSHFIQEAIESVFNQDIRDCTIEIIVVDDGSTDNTSEAVKEYGSAVKYIYQRNKGAGSARNLGIEHATGEWLAFLDSDDRWLPDKLSLQFRILKHFPECKAIHGNFYTFDETGIIIEKGLEYWVSIFTGADSVDWSRMYAKKYHSREFNIDRNGQTFDIYRGNIFGALLYGPCVSCWTLLIHRDILGTGIRFAEDYPTLEDYWFICQVAKKNEFIFADTAVAENRGHNGPRLTQTAKIHRLITQIDICEKIYVPLRDRVDPSIEEVERHFKALHIALFKEYMKRGMRQEAKETHQSIQKMPGYFDDRTYFFYRLALMSPFNIINMLVKLKQLITGSR